MGRATIPPAPQRATSRRDRRIARRIFAEHQIAELVASKSSRTCADDSALVSAKCRAQTGLKSPRSKRNLPLCESRLDSAACRPPFAPRWPAALWRVRYCRPRGLPGRLQLEGSSPARHRSAVRQLKKRQATEKMADSTKVILASASPRRRQLLGAAGISFEVIESFVPEQHEPGEPARDYALRMAREKAGAVSSRFPDAIVIGADTIVMCEAQILEKPANAGDACRMLEMLSGRTHTVVTAFALARGGSILESSPVESRVTFRKLGEAEIDDYIATEEPFDKAGAYGIQGVGGGFISHVEGSRDNVMGLPTERVVAALARWGVKPA